MKAISATLRAHQRGPARLPHVRAIARAERWGVPLLPWRRLYRGAERDCPHALAVSGGAVVRARNDGGALAVSRVASPGPASAWGVWSALGAAASGTGVALAARGAEVLLLSVAPDARALQLRRSADGGASWGAATTLARETAAIAWTAIAVRASDGDACAFYALAGGALKRLRRTGGRWETAGTAWTRGGGVSAIGGVAALHDGADYRLIVCGRARSPATKHVWSCLMGDGGFPADRWSGLNAIAESDAASAREFAGPGIFRPGGVDQRACFAARDAGADGRARVFTSHPPALTGGNPAGWSEPEPHEAASAHGLAVAAPDAANVWAAAPGGVWHARLAGAIDVSARVVEASWRLTPFGARARLALAASGGGLDALAPGGTVEIAPGYRSGAGGAPEYGAALHAAIDRVLRETDGTGARLTLECSGHWERLAAWRAPQVWQSPAGARTREALFRRLCGRAGVRVSGGGGPRWSGDRPAFALAPGESGLAAARRLLAVTDEAVVSDGDGLAVSAPAAAPVESYGAGGHPIASLALRAGAPAANWVRLRGPDGDADAHDFAGIARDGARLRLVRAHAAAGAPARAHAAAALAQARREERAGLLVAPFHAGLELFDAVAVTDARLGLRARAFRVVEAGMEYVRRPGRRPRYDSVLGLGAMD